VVRAESADDLLQAPLSVHASRCPSLSESLALEHIMLFSHMRSHLAKCGTAKHAGARPAHLLRPRSAWRTL